MDAKTNQSGKLMMKLSKSQIQREILREQWLLEGGIGEFKDWYDMRMDKIAAGLRAENEKIKSHRKSFL